MASGTTHHFPSSWSGGVHTWNNIHTFDGGTLLQVQTLEIFVLKSLLKVCYGLDKLLCTGRCCTEACFSRSVACPTKCNCMFIKLI